MVQAIFVPAPRPTGSPIRAARFVTSVAVRVYELANATHDGDEA